MAESLNQRLQEVTAAGDFVRFVGVDVITGPVTALDVTAGPDGSKDTIAAGTNISARTQVRSVRF